MRLQRLLLALGVLCVTTPAASGQGISLRWGECVADGGVRNLAFACNTNSGQVSLMNSFMLPAALAGATRVNGVIDLVAADVTLPEWWNFHTCRSGSIHMFSEAAGPILCTDFMGFCSNGGGISAIVPGVPGVNGERIQFSRLKCVPFGGAPGSDLVAGIEYVGPVLVINFTRTVGSPSCAGCGTGVCLLLTQLQVVGSGGTVTLTAPLVPPDGNVATWQGLGFTPGGACLAATPARQPTWGAVKSLYR